jgi:DNA-binding IclR family transcriptional regulator
LTALIHHYKEYFMYVKTAARVIDVVEAFAELRRPLTLSDLAKRLAIPVSSCLGLIRTLANRGYLYEVQRRGGFYPTGRLYTQAAVIAAHDPIADRVHAHLEGLRDRTGESVVLGRLKDAEVLYLDVVESPHSVRYTAEPGQFRPLHANSLGKALLGALDRKSREDLIAGIEFRKLTERTLSDPSALEADLEVSRRRGWYSNLGESAPDLGAVARPVRLVNDWYAISVAGPLHRIEQRLAQHASALRETCDAIERNAS